MKIKKLIYVIIRIPLIIVFIKTPLINILKKRFKYHRSLKTRNLLWFTLDYLFQKEYFNKLKDKTKIRELTDTTLTSGEGKKWAEKYYNKHFLTLEELKRRKFGIMTYDEANPIFNKIIDFIKNNQLDTNEDTFITQLGSSSGRDLEFFYKLFPNLNYISTDVNDEILDFQKEKYNYSNFQYYKCYAENIDECINHFNIKEKNLIIFSSGSLQYVNPYFLNEFFSKIKNYNNVNVFISEPVALKFIDESNLISDNRGNISFSHRYDDYAKQVGCKIIEKSIIRPYSKDYPIHKYAGHSFLHIKN